MTTYKQQRSAMPSGDLPVGSGGACPGFDPMDVTESLDINWRTHVMAVVRCYINAAPDTVFAVLADGWLYSNWVVGASHVRAVERAWPAVGSRLHHASGVWPIVARDETVVEDVDPGRLLVLLPKGRPLGEARVRIELEPIGTGTELTMWERPVAGPGKWLDNPITESVLKRRNVEALTRLTALVERRTEPSDV